MPLFKYVTLDRIDILVNQEIRYTQLSAFNDPFEMPVYIEKAFKNGEFENRLYKIIYEIAHNDYKNLPLKTRLKKSLAVYLKEVEKHTQSVVSGSTPSLPGYIENIALSARNALLKSDQHFGVLSLTETPDNLLMWVHYSGLHTGMVIEFDELHPIFDERKSQQDEFRYLRKVIYSDTRPILEIFGDLLIEDYAYTKSTEWSYEKEWRIAKTVTDAKRTISAPPYDICLFDMPATAIKRVILGARVSPADTDRIRNILRTMPHLGHIRLQQACLDERRFALNFADC